MSVSEQKRWKGTNISKDPFFFWKLVSSLLLTIRECNN